MIIVGGGSEAKVLSHNWFLINQQRSQQPMIENGKRHLELCWKSQGESGGLGKKMESVAAVGKANQPC